MLPEPLEAWRRLEPGEEVGPSSRPSQFSSSNSPEMGEGVPSMVTELTVQGGSDKKDPWQLVD